MVVAVVWHPPSAGPKDEAEVSEISTGPGADGLYLCSMCERPIPLQELTSQGRCGTARWNALPQLAVLSGRCEAVSSHTGLFPQEVFRLRMSSMLYFEYVVFGSAHDRQTNSVQLSPPAYENMAGAILQTW